VLIYGPGSKRKPIKLRPPSKRAKLYLIEEHGSFWDYEAGKAPVPPNLQPAKGIFLGGCVVTGMGNIDKDPNVMAHAHVRIGAGVYRGWICFQLPDYFYLPRFENVRMHELAHILSDSGHDEKWRKVMLSLGQEIHQSLLRRPRGSRKKSQQ
jgi:hypothetical protein